MDQGGADAGQGVCVQQWIVSLGSQLLPFGPLPGPADLTDSFYLELGLGHLDAPPLPLGFCVWGSGGVLCFLSETPPGRLLGNRMRPCITWSTWLEGEAGRVQGSRARARLGTNASLMSLQPAVWWNRFID